MVVHEVSERSGLESTPEWASYVAAPSGPALASLVKRTDLQARHLLIQAVETLFFEQENWRVAQHAALLHLDRFEPHTECVDLVKALCFAGYACTLSNEDPRARLVMGRVSWERRLPLAVFHDVEVARAGEGRLRAEVDAKVVDRVLGEVFLLEGLARAYLRDVSRAQESLEVAAEFGTLTVEAVVQLLVAAEPDSEASMWAANMIPDGIQLGGRAGALQHRAQRCRLLRVLQVRGTDVGS